MTPERAREAIIQARLRCVSVLSPWSDQLKNTMTDEEIAYVRRVWDTMPGNTCFVDALFRVRDGKAIDIA
jgi:hypothetical protein